LTITVAELQKSRKEGERALQRMSDAFDQFKKDMDELNRLRADLTKQRQQLSRQVEELQTTIEDFQQHSRIYNIKISGIPMHPTEDLNDIITVKIFKAFGVELCVGDIDTAHRLPAMDKSCSCCCCKTYFPQQTE